MNEKYGQKEIPFPDMDNQIQQAKNKDEKLSDHNQKLMQALNYSPKDGKSEK